MRLAAYASSQQYWRHLAPIVAELERRGVEVPVWGRDHSPWGPAFIEHLGRADVPPLMLVASHQDARRWADREVVYAEHGAGQTYSAEDLTVEPGRFGAGFAGGPGLDHVRLFLAPSERVAHKWRARYPQAAVEVVGCPALDRYGDRARGGRSSGSSRALAASTGRPEPRIVAITAHHPTWGDIPECRPALPHFDAVLPHLRIDLARAGIELVGHAHPRGSGAMIRRWENLGIRFEPDPDVILSTASLLIVDNSSIAFEAAAVDLPVLTLSAPWYRRDVEHGLRFWSHVPGLHCHEPSDLARLVYEALRDPPHATALRARAAAAAYDHLDGHAAERAADAILRLEGNDLMGEIANQVDELVDRLYLLGGTDQMARALRDLADPAELQRMRRLNDVAFAQEIAQARQLEAQEQIAAEGDAAELADQEVDG